MEKSNSCKVRNLINEISYIEALAFKNYFICLQKTVERDSLNLDKMNICEVEITKEIKLLKSEMTKASVSNASCLSNCTDLLNFPSQELTCYDKCEYDYYHSLKSLCYQLTK